MTLLDFNWNCLNGQPFDVQSLTGKKVLIVNVASACGLTPQYTQLQELYAQFGGESFEIIAFPCNDFGGQEPGSPDQIAHFCSANYGVTFPIMEKISVQGDQTHPLYTWLLAETGGDSPNEVKWNFHKFLLNEHGQVVKDLAPTTTPLDDEMLTWLTA